MNTESKMNTLYWSILRFTDVCKRLRIRILLGEGRLLSAPLARLCFSSFPLFCYACQDGLNVFINRLVNSQPDIDATLLHPKKLPEHIDSCLPLNRRLDVFYAIRGI